MALTSQFYVDNVYVVTLDVIVYIHGNGGPVTATIDPSFTIDPTFADADDYEIIYSPGLLSAPAAPEPATWVSFGIGLAGLGLLRRRRSLSGSAPANV